MKFKLSFNLIIILAVFQNSAYAEKLEWVYNVQTTIDTSKLITYQITQFSLMPNQLNLTYLEEQNSFQDEQVQASVTTNIPDSDSGIQLQLRAANLSSSCYDEDQGVINPETDFVSIYLDDNGSQDKKMEIGEPMPMPMSSGSDGFKTSDFSLWFAFGAIPDGAKICDGQVAFTVEMTL